MSHAPTGAAQPDTLGYVTDEISCAADYVAIGVLIVVIISFTLSASHKTSLK
jgi:hypothetical protein